MDATGGLPTLFEIITTSIWDYLMEHPAVTLGLLILSLIYWLFLRPRKA